MGAFAWIGSIVPWILLRVFTMLGLGLVTFSGVTTGLDALINAAVTNWASLPTDVLKLASIAGIPTAIGMICGAFSARVGLFMARAATKLVFGWVPTA